ncbi:hypothetical protein PWT90_08041 [Aphanocladium album]|nr:hypothetical protein PWT90_08041 [Aphanocladium album]
MNGNGMLGTNRELRQDTLDVLREMRARGGRALPYVLDLMLVHDVGAFPPWIGHPFWPERMGRLEVNVRVFRPDAGLIPSEWIFDCDEIEGVEWDSKSVWDLLTVLLLPRSVLDTIVTNWPEQDCSADGSPVTCDARKDQDRRDKAFRKEANLPSAPDRVNVYGPIWEAMIARLLFHPCTAETVCDQLGSLNADTRYHRPSIYHAAVLGHIGSIRSALDAFCYLVTDTA